MIALAIFGNIVEHYGKGRNASNPGQKRNFVGQESFHLVVTLIDAVCDKQNNNNYKATRTRPTTIPMSARLSKLRPSDNQEQKICFVELRRVQRLITHGGTTWPNGNTCDDRTMWCLVTNLGRGT